MIRLRNWDVLLAIWATEQLGKPFVWGETDCGSLVRQAHQAMYGEELWPDIPVYDSKISAFRVLAEVGSVRDQLLACGAVAHTRAYAQSGDILVARAPLPAFDNVLIVVADKVLVTQEDQPVTTATLWQAPLDSVAYRVPDAG